MAINGVVDQHGVLLGYQYPSQTLTLTGSPTGGTFRLSYIDHVSSAIAVSGISSSTIQTAIRTIHGWGAATVSGSGPYTITHAVADHELPFGPAYLLRVVDNQMTGGSTPYGTVTGTSQPLLWPITGDVRLGSVPPLAPKTMITNDANERASQTRASQVVWQGPLSLTKYDYNETSTISHVWDTNCWTFMNKRLLPAPRVYPTGSGWPDAGFRITDLVEFFETIYVIAHYIGWGGAAWSHGAAGTGTHIVSKSTNGTAWTTIYGGETDESHVNPGGFEIYKDYIYVPYIKQYGTANFGYATIDSTGTFTARVAADGGLNYFRCFTTWDDKLIGINYAGTVKYTTANPATTADWTTLSVKVPVPAILTDYALPIVLDCITYLNPQTGTEMVYILTTEALYALDPDVPSIRKIADMPKKRWGDSVDTAPMGGQLAVFNGKLYINGHSTVFSYDGTNLQNIGPNINDGLPAGSYYISSRTVVRRISATNKWLLIAMSVPKTVSTDHSGMVIGYNGTGLYSIFPFAAAGVQFAGYSEIGAKRLYSRDANYIQFSDESSNPILWSGVGSYTSGTIITSWYDRGLTEVVKTAYGVDIQALSATSTNYITVYYQIDYAADSTSSNTGNDPSKYWVQMVDHAGAATTITSPGTHRLYFDRALLPDGATYMTKGLPFYQIRFRIDFTIPSPTSTPPQITYFGLNHDAHFNALESYSVTLNLSDPRYGHTEDWYIETLRQMKDGNIQLVPFSFQPDRVSMVNLQSVSLVGLTPGNGSNSSSTRALATVQLSEQVPTNHH